MGRFFKPSPKGGVGLDIKLKRGTARARSIKGRRGASIKMVLLGVVIDVVVVAVVYSLQCKSARALAPRH